MKRVLFIVFIMKVTFLDTLEASEKNQIIENLKKTNSIKFDFIQITNDLIESGSCIIAYPKKMRCFYQEEKKEIIVNNDILYLINKEENKIYNYNIKDTGLEIMLNKNNIIEKISNIENFIKEKNNIIATIELNSQENIHIYFDTKKMNINGWKIKNYDKSTLEFSMQNILINISTDEKFEVPK